MNQATESERAAAARLTKELGVTVGRSSIRWWKSKGYDLNDVENLKHALRNQERNPLRVKPTTTTPAARSQPSPDLPPIDPTASLAESIDRIKELLLAAEDYETARTYKAQLEGLKAAFSLFKDQGLYVTKASQEEAGIRAGQHIKRAIQRVASELPQTIVGLDYVGTLTRCEDMVHQILVEISEGIEAS
jgi:hypothetical protein